MKYNLPATIEVDTTTSKVVISTGEKRMVLLPVTGRGEDIYCVVNDKPAPGQIKRASDVLRWLAQNLLTKSELTKLAERTNEA
mgnify:CR=1 FL=1